jgi:hypothetical protein
MTDQSSKSPNHSKNIDLVYRTEVVFSEENDRHIWVQFEKADLIGVNFCQGDEIELMTKHYCCNDPKLLRFVSAVFDHMVGEDFYERLNEALWAYSTYELNDYHDRS